MCVPVGVGGKPHFEFTIVISYEKITYIQQKRCRCLSVSKPHYSVCESFINVAFICLPWCFQWPSHTRKHKHRLLKSSYTCTDTHCGMLSPSNTHIRAGRQTHAYRMYFQSLMCKQLLLFAQTTCSFWTQTKLWRRLGYVNSEGCGGDALHERSLSTWCRLHQMVGPCRTAARSKRNSHRS